VNQPAASLKLTLRILLAAAGIVSAVTIWQMVLGPGAMSIRITDYLCAALRSDNPGLRKRAAWAVTRYPYPELVRMLVDGVLGGEAAPDAREAFVYALGRIGDRHSLGAIESVIDQDPSGYVRAAAWLAAARCDPEHFRTLVATRAAAQAAWDRIGIAQGRLQLADMRGVETLLRAARDGDDAQRYVASLTLFKGLRPLLDTAGRWPADCGLRAGQLWPPAFVDEIERRCAALNLQAIADDSLRLIKSIEATQREVRRITGARDELAEVLVGE